MTYSKPEIAVLGDAASLIQGASGSANESSSKEVPVGQINDGDLDD